MKPNKNLFMIFLLTFVSVLSVFCLTGCGEVSNNEISLAIVIGPRSNEPDIPLNTTRIKNTIYNACYTYGSVSFVSCEGNPKVYYQADIPEPEQSGLSVNKKKMIAEGYMKQLLYELSNNKASSPEVDTLKAINYASKTLNCSPENSEKILSVMDNGLSTMGYLDFSEGLLYADTESIVDSLKEAKAIPDLSGVNIEWMYLGQTVAPQEELSEAQKEKLEEIWSAILKQAGANNIKFSEEIASGLPSEGLPIVSTVDVQEQTIFVDTTVQETLGTAILDSTSVRFVGDKAEFVDEAEAMSVLKQYAEVLLAHPNNKVYIIGTTASGNADFCNELSKNRAITVKNALVSYGVSESQLSEMGLGYKDPWHVPDINQSGQQVESLACKNRKVLIVDANSEDANLLKK